MKLLSILPLFLVATTTTASPITAGDTQVTTNSTANEDTLIITENFFLETNVKYTGQHDIVNIIVPLNKINFEDDDEERYNNDITIFFVEADVDDKGERKDQGLYIYKNGKTNKILDNGRDATALNDDSTKVYFGASDGIYIYDDANGKTNKYGTLTDNIIQVEADNKTGTVYFLTKDHEVFSVADEGKKKNKVNIKDVREMAIDYDSNLFYYDSNKDLYLCNLKHGAVQKIEGIPSRKSIKLIRPMFAQEDGVFAIIDDVIYLLNADRTAEKSKGTLRVKPTAYAPEATLIHYYALEKKLYEFNVLAIISPELEELKDFLDDKKNEIQNIATKSRSSFGS
ncbi:uncharacterized protein LOC125236984 [Leguminivora glycinivorella]|uniref:uncharacterized protein LOC125236984 n=1 Tax=Leguminivora glycinivorella TaxID=1035111 RepID=UPI00200F1560|nr:uncharacterized protein LOC125236984 [Leguminivora glycinivorella]